MEDFSAQKKGVSLVHRQTRMETLRRVAKELGCSYIYDIKSALARRAGRNTKIVKLAVAADSSGANAKIIPAVYSKHKKAWMECCFPDKRQPNKRIELHILGVATWSA